MALKIDVEGHEGSVLLGGQRLLRENSCVLQVESWPENADRIAKLLAGLGYRPMHRIDEDYYYANIAIGR